MFTKRALSILSLAVFMLCSAFVLGDCGGGEPPPQVLIIDISTPTASEENIRFLAGEIGNLSVYTTTLDVMNQIGQSFKATPSIGEPKEFAGLLQYNFPELGKGGYYNMPTEEFQSLGFGDVVWISTRVGEITLAQPVAQRGTDNLFAPLSFDRSFDWSALETLNAPLN